MHIGKGPFASWFPGVETKIEDLNDEPHNLPLSNLVAMLRPARGHDADRTNLMDCRGHRRNFLPRNSSRTKTDADNAARIPSQLSLTVPGHSLSESPIRPPWAETLPWVGGN